ncbi:MAG: hypothetical protein FWB85_05280 [Chitinispirillia bacterium]|nr:hypothetical protein [Chitinispirillia bacterium]MCL2241653.1 hypothetical protein [Chitinispirillia bacterium]
MKRCSFAVRCAAVFALVLGVGAVAHADDYSDLQALEAQYGGGSSSSSSSGSSDGSFDIDELFGKFKEPEPEPEPAPTKRVLPPFEGEYKLLISRPIYAVYEAETRTKWISALGELFTHYKISSFPRTYVFTMEQVSGVLSNSRDYSRRFNKQHYIQAARRLGATHLLYQEYQPDKGGKKTRYSMELYWIQEAGTVEKFSVDIPHNDFEGGLQACLSKIAEAMDPGAKSAPAFGNTVWGKDLKSLEAFGNILADEGRFSRDNAQKTYGLADRLLQKNAALIGFQYAGALLAGRAESYAKAAHHLDAVIAKSRGDHAALQLRRAEYLRGAERFSEAMTAAETAVRNSALRIPASIEMAMIYQAQGNMDRARSEYEAIVQSGQADGRVLFMLALLSIQMGRASESEDYLRQAAERGLALDEGEYIELGRAYAASGSGNEDRAIEFLKRGMGVKQNNEEAWEEIAEVYKRMGNEVLAADAYVNLFKINMQEHSLKLKAAGEIYEKLGMTDKAKDAYSLFLDRRFSNKDVSMSLARIYFNDNDCKRVQQTLKGMETVPEAIQMLGDCGIKVRLLDSTLTMRKTELSPFMLTMRISGAVVAAGGLAGGLALNYGVIEPTHEKYQNYPKMGQDGEMPNPSDPNFWEKGGASAANVAKWRKEIDDGILMRNLLYILAGVGFSGFAVTFFF